MIQDFIDIINERKWELQTFTEILQNIERRLTKGGCDELKLTKFQRKAISAPDFWRDWDKEKTDHLMIQGATSAGKTLLSELNAIDTLNNDRKVIVLVPLKAMVHERTKQFSQDMTVESDELQIDVFGASSDYMEFDERLINGEYSVAIIVYEKFFAMLGQGGGKLMQNCGLLVVDELSMLSQEQRGPKIEMALQIVREKYPHTRIMAMATCDCSTEKFCKWLNIKQPIVSSARPVALIEHLLMTDGKGKLRRIPADLDLSEDPENQLVQESEEKIEIPGYRQDLRQQEKQRKLLLAVIDKVYRQTPDARLMVFVATQAQANDIARFLKENAQQYFKNNIESSDFIEKIKNCDHDDDQKALVDSYIPYGIAYHHSGISTGIREIIEEEFQKKESTLRVIVATETLTVGVNLPVDVMIMLTNKVPRGTGKMEPLTIQEYRNYIGRAGRLGHSDREGESYIFLDEKKYFDIYWNSYRKREEILSTLTKADEKRLAPYYLGLIYNNVGNTDPTNSSFSNAQLQLINESSFAHTCGTTGFKAATLYRFLWDYYLADKISVIRTRSYNSEMEVYGLEEFGVHMAKYALSLETILKIYLYFYNGYENGGLPLETTREDIDNDKYLLDILYHVCMHYEIASSTNLIYPRFDEHSEKKARGKYYVLNALKTILDKKDGNGDPVNVLFCSGEDKQNDLWELLNKKNIVDESDKLQGAMRAIILFYWTKGYTVKEIDNNTKFSSFTRVISGDIERVAEAVSFHLDAIRNCLQTAIQNGTLKRVLDDSARHSFYFLQTRVKYGMPRDLVIFANKHIHGLDRANLLRLKKHADSCGLTPIQYLYTAPSGELQEKKFMTLSQQTQLIRAIERRGNATKIETLIEIVTKDAGSQIGEPETQCLRAIAEWGSSGESTEPSDIYNALKELRKAEVLSAVSIATDGSASKILWNCGTAQKLRIGVLGGDQLSERCSDIYTFFREENNAASVIIVPFSAKLSEIQKVYDVYGVNAVADNIYFISALANAIRIGLDKGEALTAFFDDLRGVFTSANRYFPIPQYANKIAVKKQKNNGKQALYYRIVSGAHWVDRSGSSENEDRLIEALSNTPDLNHFDIMPWGEKLLAEIDDLCPTVILLERNNVLFSNSLNELIFRMRNRSAENSLIVFFSEKAKERWYETAESDRFGNRWSDQYGKIQNYVLSDIESTINRIRQFVHQYQRKQYLIGISYAHYQNDSRDALWQRDDQLIEMLAEKLRDTYGEECILFDRFSPAKALFEQNRAEEKSLDAYRECKAYIILWNYWTVENGNCRNEREEAIFPSCENNTDRCCLFLTTLRSDKAVPDPPRPYFSLLLSEETIDHIVDVIHENLNGYKN